MKRTLYLGDTVDGALFVFIELRKEDRLEFGEEVEEVQVTELSMTYVEGPTPAGNAKGSAGAGVAFAVSRLIKYAKGWDRDKARELAKVADRWHLNALRAGSPNQREYLIQNPPRDDVSDHYQWATDTLQRAGLNPDPGYIHNGAPYSYGSAWLFEELPPEVIKTVTNWPNGGGRRPPGEWDR